MGQVDLPNPHWEALTPDLIDRTPWPVMKRFLERLALEAGRKQLKDLWG